MTGMSNFSLARPREKTNPKTPVFLLFNGNYRRKISSNPITRIDSPDETMTFRSTDFKSARLFHSISDNLANYRQDISLN